MRHFISYLPNANEHWWSAGNSTFYYVKKILHVTYTGLLASGYADYKGKMLSAHSLPSRGAPSIWIESSHGL